MQFVDYKILSPKCEPITTAVDCFLIKANIAMLQSKYKIKIRNGEKALQTLFSHHLRTSNILRPAVVK